jgi:subtilisin family serine protease
LGTDTYSQSYAATQVTNAWGIAKAYNNATAKTIVAVIDTGLDANHGVFKDSNSIWTNTAEFYGTPGVDDDGNGYVDDIHGWNFYGRNANPNDDNEHGSHVAGIVLGVGEDINVIPVRESRIQIMPLKFLDSTGSGSTSDAISAITYAVRNGAKVINNSWGGSSYSRALHEAYTYAYNNNVVVVSAAGNNSQNIDTYPVYPGALDTPSNITVASTTDSDLLSSFSNYSVAGIAHVSAPGSSILSPVPAKGLTCSYPGCFKYMSGTSMATPFVAGLAALVIREAPQLSAYQIKGLILGSVDTKASLINRVQTSGRVNALKAVQAGINSVGTAYWSPAYSPAYKVDSSSTAASSSGGGGGGCGMVQVLESSVSGLSGGMTADTELLNILSVLFMILFPVLVSLKLRDKKLDYVRKHSRFNLSKVMQIKMNDQVIDLISNTVSLGGFSFSKDMAIDKGQKIKVKIDNTEVDAEVVWSRENNSYGVKFASITDALKSEIESWTQGMIPTS